jgi:hypothetical protein
MPGTTTNHKAHWDEKAGVIFTPEKEYDTMSEFEHRRKVVTPAEREAQSVFRKAEAEKALLEHERAQKVFHENFQRLKAERLAREAASQKA